MSDAPEDDDVPKASSKLPLVIGVVGAIAAGAGGFFFLPFGAAQSDSLTQDTHDDAHGDTHSEDHASTEHASEDHDDVHGHAEEGHGAGLHGFASKYEDSAFVAVEPVVVNLPPGGHHSYLRFVAQLEVSGDDVSKLEAGMPRVIDIMNTYLRAVRPEDFDERQILSRMRVHLVARINAALGQPLVKDVLIMEFLLS